MLWTWECKGICVHHQTAAAHQKQLPLVSIWGLQTDCGAFKSVTPRQCHCASRSGYSNPRRRRCSSIKHNSGSQAITARGVCTCCSRVWSVRRAIFQHLAILLPIPENGVLPSTVLALGTVSQDFPFSKLTTKGTTFVSNSF